MSNQLATRPPRRRPSPPSPEVRAGKWLVAVVGLILLVVVLPVIVRGGLLADEYVICMRPIHDGGYGAYLSAIWHDTGIVRPARFIELLLISKACTHGPYGLAILVPLSLKFASAALLYRLLGDLDLRAPWPAIGAAIWLLEPVGTEAELWPAALHVLLGLTLALWALRLYHRGSLVWGAIATVAAALSVEQVIFALPLAVWLVTPPEHRRRATVVAAGALAMVLLAYATWPGSNPRQAVSLADRLHNAFDDPKWYLFFPAVGIGLYSAPLAFVWAFPVSLAVVAAGAGAGTWASRALLGGEVGRRVVRTTFIRGVLAAAALVILINLPLIVTEVGYSARTFTPTWLALSAAAAVAGASVRWRRIRLVGAIAGALAAFAFLSLALSVSVRLRTDSFNKAAAQWTADRTSDGDVVAVCDVGRTVVEPAPLGAYHLHEFHSTSGDWIEYLTGRVVHIRRSGLTYWGSRCPNLKGADLVIEFPDLVRQIEDTGG